MCSATDRNPFLTKLSPGFIRGFRFKSPHRSNIPLDTPKIVFKMRYLREGYARTVSLLEGEFWLRVFRRGWERGRRVWVSLRAASTERQARVGHHINR